MKRSIYFSTISFFPQLPYPWGIMRAYCEEDLEVREAYVWETPFYMGNRTPEAYVDEMERPFLFASSNYSWNYAFHLAQCRLIKARWPDCVTVVGGPEIPEKNLEPFFEQHPYVDVVVHGEGEIPMRRLLREYLEVSPDLSLIESISYRTTGGVRQNPTRREHQLPREITDSALPSPYLLGYFDDMVAPLKDAWRAQYVWAVWETNRGCPYSCTFCEWGAAALNKLKLFEIERLKQEIERIAELGVDLLYCADANFGILERDLEIAKHIAATKERTGFPRYFGCNFAKNSNDRVFEISALLAKRGMIKGTTLAMQSVDNDVLVAIKRRTIGIERYQDLKRKYDDAGIPTYVDLIVALPLESKKTFLDGIYTLLETGHHDDLRVFELHLLPNTPMRDDVEKYGLCSVTIPLSANAHSGTVDVVYASNTMSFDDWIDVMAFGDFVAHSLHCGGYTKFISVFLHREKLMSYREFYRRFLLATERRGGDVQKIFERLKRMYREFITDRIPIGSKVSSHPDLRADIGRYQSSDLKHTFWSFDWVWLKLHEARTELYDLVSQTLAEAGIAGRPDVADCLRYQQDLMLRPSYDPARGRTVEYAHDWPAYFAGTGAPQLGRVVVKYHDERMGTDMQHALIPDSDKHFALAALGHYFHEGRNRRFYHQTDRMVREAPTERGLRGLPALTPQP